MLTRASAKVINLIGNPGPDGWSSGWLSPKLWPFLCICVCSGASIHSRSFVAGFFVLFFQFQKLFNHHLKVKVGKTLKILTWNHVELFLLPHQDIQNYGARAEDANVLNIIFLQGPAHPGGNPHLWPDCWRTWAGLLDWTCVPCYLKLFSQRRTTMNVLLFILVDMTNWMLTLASRHATVVLWLVQERVGEFLNSGSAPLSWRTCFYHVAPPCTVGGRM